MDTPEQARLNELRNNIDRLDQTLVDLLNQRVRAALEIGGLKRAQATPFYVPERELQVFERIAKANEGPLRPEQLNQIFREVISATLAAEAPLNVGFLGPSGSLGHMAAAAAFGTSSTFLPLPTVQEVFENVVRKQCAYGVVPVQSALSGVSAETLDSFKASHVRICREVVVSHEYHLLSLAPSTSQVHMVFADADSFLQCRDWLRENLPGVGHEILPDAYQSAAKVQGDRSAASIGNHLIARQFGLATLHRGINLGFEDRTRFVVIGFNEPGPTGRDRTSVMFTLRNSPGELWKALSVFKEHDVNLLMIESRASLRPEFEYTFFCDLAGHRTEGPIESALAELTHCTSDLTVLGSYPASSGVDA